MLNRAAQWMTDWGASVMLIAAIASGSALGIALPDAGNAFSSQIDNSILLLVFLLLFEVRFSHVLSSLRKARFIIAALLTNFIIIPALGYSIASLFLSTHPLFFIGLLIYFMAPCTDWFLAFTKLAKGNTALGAALLPINLIIQLLLYPVYLQLFGIDAIAGVAAGELTQTLWQWFLLPLIAAVVCRFVLERIANAKLFDSIQSTTSALIPLLLALLVGQITVANIGTLTDYVSVFPLILGAIFLFFALTYCVSEVISKRMKLPYENRVLMTMTTSARNSPLMLAITMVVIPDQLIVYAAIIIGMLVELPHLVGLKMLLLRAHPD